jgi:hypothetical protein
MAWHCHIKAKRENCLQMQAGTMRPFLSLVAALAIGIGGLILASLVPSENSALAAKAKKSKQHSEQISRPSVPRSSGFEHQQCTWQNPCPARNLY